MVRKSAFLFGFICMPFLRGLVLITNAAICARSEIDRLTELLHSRTVDAPQGDEDTRTELNVPQPLSTAGIRHELTRSPTQANGIEPHLESHKFHGRISTPGASSLVCYHALVS